MNNILNITEHLQEKKRRKREEICRDRLETVRRVVQCAACPFKCAMCGQHLQDDDLPCPAISPQSGHPLCESCHAEYQDFLRESRGGKEADDIVWHNQEWVALWAAWLEFQRALQAFSHSHEFKQINGKPDT